ncbi:MAG: hypothetical protein U9R14_02610 [Patescibacteria group bacterium]|nr:hypothetical protein [Patescibacteria group bacterium]
MILCINTIQEDNIVIALKNSKGAVVQKKFKAKYKPAEKLLPLVDKLLKQNKSEIQDIKKIQVVNQGESGTSFTALRIGIVIANTLGYAIGIPVKPSESLLADSGEAGCMVKSKKLKVKSKKFEFDIVQPVYSKEPNITQHVTCNKLRI